MKATWNVPRELAEQAARETYETRCQVAIRFGIGPFLIWELLPDVERQIDMEVQRTLFADLCRPASRDVAARELARRVKMECDGSPGWHYDVTTGGWVLTGDHHTRRVFVGDESDTAAYHKRYGRPNVTFMPGNPTDPAEALALALAATEPTNGQ